MNILIRADSSSALGLGHIMRCLVLATQFPDDIITFACQNLSGNIIDKIPHPVHLLRSNDPQELIKIITAHSIDKVIFDHYAIDAVFEKQIKAAANITIMSLDDTYAHHHCDILLNHNIYADATRYEGLVPPQCEVQCGSNFTLIRDEFKSEKIMVKEKIYDIFISMGGADTANITSDILRCIPLSKSVCITTTSANANLTQLLASTLDNDKIEIHVNSDEIAKLLHQSHLAIVTPSVMVHEVLFMEIPFIAIQTAPNQSEMADYLLSHNYTVLPHFDPQILREKLA